MSLLPPPLRSLPLEVGRQRSPAATRILAHFRHKFARFDGLLTSNIVCLLSIKRKFRDIFVILSPGRKKDLEHNLAAV